MNLEINKASKRLNRLVDNLLNVSRLESGHVILKWDWCDVGELIAAAVDRLSPDILQRSIVMKIPEHIPLVRLDFVLMEQAIFNLLHNSTIYAGETTAVTVRAEYQNDTLEIEISDNGPGFNPEDLERIFEKFYRPHGSKAGGLGLGLTIVKGVIEAHHGRIEVKNQDSGGAIITLSIPTGHLQPTTLQAN